MKKALCLILVWMFLFVCFAEGEAITEWSDSFNLIAETHGLETIDPKLFEYDSEDGLGDYYIYAFDEDTGLMICLDDNRDTLLVSMEAKAGDGRLASLLACALTVGCEEADYEGAYKNIVQIVTSLAFRETAVGYLFGWYYMAYSVTEEDGSQYVLLGFTNMSDEKESEKPEEQTPDKNEPQPEPAPETPKPKDETIYHKI